MDRAVDVQPHDPDLHLQRARAQVEEVMRGDMPSPSVKTFFDKATCTATHVVHDPATSEAAIIDSVMDFDPATGRTSFQHADAILDYVTSEGLSVEFLLETHVHADHLSAAAYLQGKLGGKIAIGEGIREVQDVFGRVFNEDSTFQADGSQFDRLLVDGDTFELGSISAIALHVPGHTALDMAYIIGDAAFVGDTIFMPDYGTARTDFPGGDAHELYKSIRRLMALPRETRIFLCHDYKGPNRDEFVWETNIAAECACNIHVHEMVDEESFVSMRTTRDKALPMPRLMLASVQVNMRAGRLPDPESNGTSYLKLPLNQF